MVLTDEARIYVRSDRWVADALGPGAAVVRTQAWGVLTERRVRLPSALEVELGFAPCSWAKTDPVDPGTAEVVRDGCRPLFDPDGALASLVTVIGR